MESGIYKITVKDRLYIGSSVNIKKRWYNHKYTLHKNIHRNPILQNYYNKYGLDIFEFEIIELCDEKDLIEREQYWIDLLKSSLNCCKIAGKPPKKTDEQKLENSLFLKKILSKKIYQYDLNGNYIKEWFNIKEVGDFYKINKTGVSKCANGNFRSFGGFIWLHDKCDKIDPYIDTSLRSVTLYDINGEYYKNFISILSCSEFLNINSSTIRNALIRKGLIVGKYYVLYSEKEFVFSEYKKKEKLISLYDKHKQKIGVFHRLDLINNFKMNKVAITRFLNSKKDKIYKGYYLRYEDDKI